MRVKRNRTTKKRGRPPTGRALPVRQLRMPDKLSDAVTAWAKQQADKPNWSEAVRRLVAFALERWR